MYFLDGLQNQSSLFAEGFHNSALRSSSLGRPIEVTTCCILPCLFLLNFSRSFRLLFPPKIQRTLPFQSASVALFLICECKDSGSPPTAQELFEKSFKFLDFCRFLRLILTILLYKDSKVRVFRVKIGYSHERYGVYSAKQRFLDEPGRL